MTTDQKDQATSTPAETPASNAGQTKALPNAGKAARQSARMHPLSMVNLFLIAGLAGVAGYGGWLAWQQQQQTAAEMAVLRDRLQQTQNEASALAATEGELLVKTEGLLKQASSLAEQVAHNTDRLGKLPGAERQDWLLAEAEYLMRMANQRLQLERDWSGALSMLQAADNVLVETRNPAYSKVRAQLAKEMLALRAAPALDYTGAVLRLQALQEAIPQLPWVPERMLPEAQTEVSEEPAAASDLSWYEGLWQRLSQALVGMVRIRDREVPVQGPLSPDQQYYLQQNMHLMLEQAQIALLRQQADLYQHSLKRVADWLNEYLMMADDQARAVQASLQELQQWNVAPAIPDISNSLQLLQKKIEEQRRGTVAPAAEADA